LSGRKPFQPDAYHAPRSPKLQRLILNLKTNMHACLILFCVFFEEEYHCNQIYDAI